MEVIAYRMRAMPLDIPWDGVVTEKYCSDLFKIHGRHLYHQRLAWLYEQFLRRRISFTGIQVWIDCIATALSCSEQQNLFKEIPGLACKYIRPA